jgi:Iron-containing redox enzyme
VEMQLPRPRGALSEAVVGLLRGDCGLEQGRFETRVVESEDLMTDEDVQLALWMLYELHYRGFAGCDDLEWDPRVMVLRATIERHFEAELRRRTTDVLSSAKTSCHDLLDQMVFMIDHAGGPDLPSFLQRRATREQVMEFLVQRSLYHLKESDPHSFVLPRIDGRAKVALAELQYDEYGAGQPERLHSRLFADALAACGLDPRYGAYVDRVPGHTLASNNLSSLFGLHRRLRGAAVGHLAAFEATSSVPCRRIAAGIERVGLPPAVADYFHEHVEADATHEQVALRDVCAALVEDEPQLHDDVLFGLASCLHIDGVVAEHLWDEWSPSTVDERRPVAS